MVLIILVVCRVVLASCIADKHDDDHPSDVPTGEMRNILPNLTVTIYPHSQQARLSSYRETCRHCKVQTRVGPVSRGMELQEGTFVRDTFLVTLWMTVFFRRLGEDRSHDPLILGRLPGEEPKF